MKYYVETSLENFEAWSGGRDTLDVLIEKGLCDTVENILNDIYADEAPTDTEINDTLWFSRDEIAEWCGFSSWEALENGEGEEEEPEDNNFSRYCSQFNGGDCPPCSGCPYQKLKTLADCETAYYHDNPDDDDGIRIYQ